MAPLVNRLVYIAIRSTQPGDCVIELHLSTGYFTYEGKYAEKGFYVETNNFRHVVDDAAGKAIFAAHPDGNLPLMEDLRTQLEVYLNDKNLLHGDLVA